jgi:hypothetical protein
MCSAYTCHRSLGFPLAYRAMCAGGGAGGPQRLFAAGANLPQPGPMPHPTQHAMGKPPTHKPFYHTQWMDSTLVEPIDHHYLLMLTNHYSYLLGRIESKPLPFPTDL